MTTTNLSAEVKRILELDEKRTPGEEFSIFPQEYAGECWLSLSADSGIVDVTDIDLHFIAAAPAMAKKAAGV